MIRMTIAASMLAVPLLTGLAHAGTPTSARIVAAGTAPDGATPIAACVNVITGPAITAYVRLPARPHCETEVINLSGVAQWVCPPSTGAFDAGGVGQCVPILAGFNERFFPVGGPMDWEIYN